MAKTEGRRRRAGRTDLSQTGASYAANAERDLIVDQTALDQWAGLYLSGQSAKDPLASPVHGDFSGLAPMLIHVGSDEVLLSDSTRLAEAAGMARVSVELLIAPDMPHVWHFMWAQLAPAREAIARGRVDKSPRGMRRQRRWTDASRRIELARAASVSEDSLIRPDGIGSKAAN